MAERQPPALISLWVKPEPFSFGILPVSPTPLLAPKLLKKIIPYVLKKKELGFPKLKYSVWRHIACSKLQLPEELAWLFFTTYFSLTKIRAEDRIMWDNEFSKCDRKERENTKSSCRVDTLKFVLLLMIQMINKTIIRSSSLSSLSLEEWPVATRNSGFTDNKKEPKTLDEQRYLAFILTHVEDMLELISLPTDVSSGKDEISVSADCLAALDFLIEGSLSGQMTVCTVTELITKNRSVCGYSPQDRTFQLRPLAAWLRAKLVPNPFGISSCLTSGYRLSWPGASRYEEKRVKSQKGRMTTSVLFSPKGKTVVVLSQLNSQTVCRTPRTLRGAYVQIHRCHECHIYLLAPMKCVSIYKCRNCTIVLGPTASCVHVSMCKNLTLISVTRQLWISDTGHGNFYSLIPTHPVLAGNRNDSIYLAPYNTYYAQLEEHMDEVGIGLKLNFWDDPLCLASDSSVGMSKSWQLFPPENFFGFSIPFEMTGKTIGIPYPLPTIYQQALIRCEQNASDWNLQLENCNLTNEQNYQLQTLIHRRFEAWLTSSGHQQELDSLITLAKYTGEHRS